VVERQTPLPPLKDMMINELNLTELETKTLNTYIDCLYAEPGFSDVDVNDLSEILGISTKILRGALGSLAKKGFVTINTNDSGYDIIDLNTKYWYLVNESWAEEAKMYL
jgi:DNA-binding MarR family transcriptional regulator